MQPRITNFNSKKVGFQKLLKIRNVQVGLVFGISVIGLLQCCLLPWNFPRMDSEKWQQPHTLQKQRPIEEQALPTTSILEHSCPDLFGSHQLQKVQIATTTCLQHRLLHWLACEIGVPSVQIDTRKIQGSLGGEDVTSVIGRSEEEELLRFEDGALCAPYPLPQQLLDHSDRHMKRFLQSARVLDPVSTPLAAGNTGSSSTIRKHDSAITLLVRRGNYANPCMALLTMYNVYIVLEHYYRYSFTTVHKQNDLKIVWLDGHARGDLDPVWESLFGTKPIHIQQLRLRNNSSSPLLELPNGMVVNTMSAIGDEGLHLYRWPRDRKGDLFALNATEHKECLDNSTLAAFRDFVLERHGLMRRKPLVEEQQPKLTLLVRKESYLAHPRSNDRTDRSLANVQTDVEYLRSQYPSHTIEAVSFEGMPFIEQLRQIVTTDVFVAVHGAGNVHVLFLPDDAIFVEYIPKNFQLRRRFQFLAQCLNVQYIPKTAWIKRRHQKGNHKGHEQKDIIQVQIAPTF